MNTFSKLALVAGAALAYQWYIDANRPVPVAPVQSSQAASISRVNSDGSETVLWNR